MINIRLWFLSFKFIWIARTNVAKENSLNFPMKSTLTRVYEKFNCVDEIDIKRTKEIFDGKKSIKRKFLVLECVSVVHLHEFPIDS